MDIDCHCPDCSLGCDGPGTIIPWPPGSFPEMIPIPDMVNNPPHYKGNKLESIDIIEDFSLGFHLGNAVKYILRAGKKGDKLEDLNKAIWYLQRECQNIEKEKLFGSDK